MPEHIKMQTSIYVDHQPVLRYIFCEEIAYRAINGNIR